MENDKKPVETKVEVAGTPTQPVATVIATEVDYEALLAEKEAKIAKIEEERNNYRKGLLKAKGKLPEDYQTDTDETETQEEMFRRIAREERLSTEETQLRAEKDQALKDVLKQNRELQLALKNRGQITTTSAPGSNQDKPEGKVDNFFSNDQINALKAKGYDDKKIELLKKNMSKVNEMPR